MSKAKPEHYVNNKEFTLQYQNTIVQLNKFADGKEPPRVSEYIGECISKLQRDYQPNQTSSTILIGMK